MVAEDVWLCECAARDGLQHEPKYVATDDKVRMINAFTKAGFTRIEAGSFSHPERVPQFADVEEVLRRIDRGPGVVYKTTCVNVRAAERAVAAVRNGAGPNEISCPVSASETANMANTHRTIQQSTEIVKDIVGAIEGSGLVLTATAAAAYGCPAEGPTPPKAVSDLVEKFSELGVKQVIIGDSNGFASPRSVRENVGPLPDRFPEITFICHFHDNRGAGISNVFTALDLGIRHFDCSMGGIGGKPAGFDVLGKKGTGEAPAGNVATEDLAVLLEDCGYSTGLSMEDMIVASRLVEDVLGRELYSRTARAGIPYAR